MTTRADLEAELLTRLQVADNSTLFPSARLTSLIKNAYIWATQFVVWHDLVRARATDSVAGQEYYDYPSNFRSESIIRLEVDDEEYSRRNYEDYLAFKRRNPTSTKKMFSSFGRQFFINPTPSTDGSANITAWGAIQADALSDSTSVPIFSYNKEEGNEAVIKKALSVALGRTDTRFAQMELQDAISILLRLSTEEHQNTQRNQRLDHPMFDVPDYLNGNGTTPYQRFNYDPSEV